MSDRQAAPTLDAALERAASMMRAQSLEYRNPDGAKAKRFSKQIRRNIAASLDDFARLLETHRTELAKEQPK